MTATQALDPSLLQSILRKARQGTVVPIIGPDVLRVSADDGTDELLYAKLARDVARELDLAELAEHTSPSFDMVYAEAKRRGRSMNDFEELVADAVRQYERQRPPLPEALQLLGPIDWFPLCLSLTCDNLLARSIDELRFGRPRTVTGAYRPNDWEDIPAADPSGQSAVVYQLMGSARAMKGQFAVTEADAVEFFHFLQQPERQPRRLLDQLRGAHLLVLGANLPDWLLRFLLRVCRGQSISMPRQRQEFVVGQTASVAPGLVHFIETHAPDTQCVDADPIALLRALHGAWAEETGPRATLSPRADVDESLQPGRFAFISYASADRDAAVRLQVMLEEARVPVWLDKDGGLSGGVEWDRRIRRRIEECGVFIPLLSRECEHRMEQWAQAGNAPSERPYFSREWDLACALAVGGQRGEGFLQPLAIEGEILVGASKVQAMFADVQASNAPGGRADNRFIRNISRLIGAERRGH